ncbi:C-GCAxxG-C-C family protein [Solidesulfovibrio sp.]|uniref:C-GCAxxG-C-C family protein n=1 Tax=Solidesulfovibrio sp. TaxID=2910990 RepID=UPI002633AA1A|nr:C-GCAxxG-C-C family protein [Solidesulfovibrio sp.]
MTRQETERYAFETKGLNCAETLLRAGIDCLGIQSNGTPSRIATCFGGGLGRCQEELCGALAGGTMALGLAYGRDTAGDSAETAYEAAAEFRRRFVALHGASRCRELLEVFGEQEDWSACKRLMAEAAGLLYDLVSEVSDRT